MTELGLVPSNPERVHTSTWEKPLLSELQLSIWKEIQNSAEPHGVWGKYFWDGGHEHPSHLLYKQRPLEDTMILLFPISQMTMAR